MFFAINIVTKKLVESYDVPRDPSYQFPENDIWYADPNSIDIEHTNKELDINKIVVTYVHQSEPIISPSGKTYVHSPHFRIQNKEKLGIYDIPESKEHLMVKNWVYNLIIGGFDISFCYSELTKPQIKNIIKLSELCPNFSAGMVGVEAREKMPGLKVYDIIIPFIKRHPYFGEGIAVEVQFSNQSVPIEEKRSLDRALTGYSTAWLHISDFNKISEQMIELKNDTIPLSPFIRLIEKASEDITQNIRYTIQSEMRMLDFKVQQTKEEVARLIQIDPILNGKVAGCMQQYIPTLKKSLLQPILSETCPRCDAKVILKYNKINLQPFYSCSNYPTCKFTLRVVI